MRFFFLYDEKRVWDQYLAHSVRRQRLEKKTPKINIRYDEEKSCVYLITQVVTLRNITKAYPNEVFTRKQSLNT